MRKIGRPKPTWKRTGVEEASTLWQKIESDGEQQQEYSDDAVLLA